MTNIDYTLTERRIIEYMASLYPNVDYKLTKKEIECPGDLFSLGCQVANEDIQRSLSEIGYELSRNDMKKLMDTIIFHINRY